MRASIIFAALVFGLSSAHAAELTIGTLNTESDGDTYPFLVGEVIRDVGMVDVWALQEVQDLQSVVDYTVATASASSRKSYRYVLSQSGAIASPHRRNDHLALVYNSSRLRQVETVEFHGVRSEPGEGRLGEANWRLRAALFIRLYDYETGREFYVGNVHLKCCGDGKEIRAHQASLISDWVEGADVPVILAGDFNIPIEPTAVDGNQDSAAFQTLLQRMTWLRPDNPVTTQCNPRFNSMLDHFFVTQGDDIAVTSVEISRPDEDYCSLDEEGYPDHRPMIAKLEFSQE